MLAAGFATVPGLLTVLVAFVLGVPLLDWLGGTDSAFVVLMAVYTVLLFALFERLSVGYTVRSLFTDGE